VQQNGLGSVEVVETDVRLGMRVEVSRLADVCFGYAEGMGRSGHRGKGNCLHDQRQVDVEIVIFTLCIQ